MSKKKVILLPVVLSFILSSLVILYLIHMNNGSPREKLIAMPSGTDTLTIFFRKTVVIRSQDHLYGNGRSKTVVFGYLPDWMYIRARKSLRYDILTHIACFRFILNDKAGFEYPEHWPWKDVIKNAHRSNVRVLMTVFSEDGELINRVINQYDFKSAFIHNLSNSLEKYKLDGVNINFESLLDKDKGSGINSFMKELTDSLHRRNPEWEVSFAGPAVNWDNKWDLPGLAESCDYIFVMSYCFFGSWSPFSGPAATLTGRKYCVDSTFTNRISGYGQVLENKPEKLVMGIPFYGNYWITEDGSPNSKVIRFLKNLTYDEIVRMVSNHQRKWKDDYKVPWFSFMNEGNWYQIWYDDKESIGLKLEYALFRKLRGVGIWALGYGGGRNELWDELAGRLIIDTNKVVTRNDRDITNPESVIGTESNQYSTALFAPSENGEELVIISGINKDSLIHPRKTTEINPDIQ